MPGPDAAARTERIGRCWWRSSCDPTGRAGRTPAPGRPATRRSRVENCGTSRASAPPRSNQSRIETTNKTPCGHRPGLPRRGEFWGVGQSDVRWPRRLQLVCDSQQCRWHEFEFPHTVAHSLPCEQPCQRSSVALPLGINRDAKHSKDGRIYPKYKAASARQLPQTGPCGRLVNLAPASGNFASVPGPKE